jgi:uncharacterized protein
VSIASTRTTPPTLHTPRHTGGKAVGRLLGLPPTTTDYTLQRVRVPMRDGVDLSTNGAADAGGDLG